jgi:hypothetical protein
MPKEAEKKLVGDAIAFRLLNGPRQGATMAEIRDKLGLEHLTMRLVRSAIWHAAHVRCILKVSRPSIEHRIEENRPFMLSYVDG